MPTKSKTKHGAVNTYRVIGVMSGSSLDGLDLALCSLKKTGGRWSYAIEKAVTAPFPRSWRAALIDLCEGTALDLSVMHQDFGDLIGEKCAAHFKGLKKVHLIASHGHTIFHEPNSRHTMQLGLGAAIAQKTGITTVCDFRVTDVQWGGQGAPLVPVGEKLLFPQYKAFMNLGGICNISVHGPKRIGTGAGPGIVGYDVCIGNQALNFLANLAGSAFDTGGAIARKGTVNATLLDRLNTLPFHHQKPPRSLGREWFIREVLPLINDKDIPVNDRMRTVVEHIAQQLGSALKKVKTPVLVTGGGAHNTFLMERIRAITKAPIDVPDKLTVDYKEALVFALLGVLRIRGEVNALASVTGAKRDSVGGAVYLA